MLYKIKMPLTTITGEKIQVPRLILAKFDSTTETPAVAKFNEVYTEVDLLKSKALLEDFNPIEFGIQISCKASDKHPIIIVPSTNGKSCDITTLYNFFSKYMNSNLRDEVYSSIFEKINQNGWATAFGVDIPLLKIINSIVCFMPTYHSKDVDFAIDFNKELLENPAYDIGILADINTRNSLSYLANGSNKTLYMQSPLDKLFIQLPSFERVLADPKVLMKLPMSSLFQPYSEKMYHKYQFRDYLKPSDSIKDIIGSPENNDLEIEDNEMEFFQAMKELIDYGAMQYYPNNSIEDCRKYGHSHPAVTSYLLELAYRVGSWNWGHTGCYPLYPLDDATDEDNIVEIESNASNSEKSYDRLLVDDSAAMIDAEVMIKNLVEKSIKKGNIYAPAEAVIKLMRWGIRKPNKWKLSNLDSYLDLNDFSISTSSGTFQNREVLKQDGATYTPISFIIANDKIKDTAYLRAMGKSSSALAIPVGLLCSKKYMDGSKQFFAFSIPSIIEHIQQYPDDILGIKMVNSKIVSNLDITIDENTTDIHMLVNLVDNCQDGSKVYYLTDDLENFFLEFNVLTTTTSDLAIIEKYLTEREILANLDAKRFENVTELYSNYALEYNLDLSESALQGSKEFLKGTTGIRPFLEANIAGQLLPILLDVAEEKLCLRKQGRASNISLADWLNMFNTIMAKHNLKSYCSVFNKNATISTTANAISEILCFNSADNNEGGLKLKIEQLCNKTVSPGMRVWNMVDNPDTTKHIGYVFTSDQGSLNQGFHFIFSLNLPNGFNKEMKKIKVTTFKELFRQDFFKFLRNEIGQQDIHLTFADEASFNFFLSLLLC